MKEIYAVIAIVVFIILFYCLGLVSGEHYGREAERKEAVKAGVAHYTCDPDTGKASFEYRGSVKRETEN